MNTEYKFIYDNINNGAGECFFCGKKHPEHIVKVSLKNKPYFVFTDTLAYICTECANSRADKAAENNGIFER